MRQCILVLGTHRSGTSALMGALLRMGVYIGGSWLVDHYENDKVVELNEMLLAACGSSWDDVFELRENWWQDPRLSDLKEKALELLHQQFREHVLFGVKDPRMCVVLPFWIEVLGKLEAAPQVLIPLRDPFEVVDSHAKRDKFGVEKSLLLWLNQVLCAEFYSRGFKRCFSRFDDLLKDPVAVMARFSEKLDIEFPRPMAQALQDVRQFLKPGLKHHNYHGEQRDISKFPRPFRELYQHLFVKPGHLDQIDKEPTVWDSCRREFLQCRSFYLNSTLRQDWVRLKRENIAYTRILLQRLIRTGMELIRMKQHEGAVKLFSDLTDLLPEHPSLWNNLGISHEYNGDPERALTCFKTALEHAPGYHLAAENCARIREMMQKNPGCDLKTNSSREHEARQS